MNGVNINLFQFEYDLTWMAFFMDARDRVYARYGGREDHDAESHLNKESLVRLMRKVIELHRTKRVQTSRYEAAGNPPRTPEDIPSMKALMARRKENKCIHCHDVKVARLRHLQTLGKFSRDMIFTYPTPSSVGIAIDPKRQEMVRSVRPASPAHRAGIRAGDELLSVDGQRILSLGDFSRVLHLASEEAELPLNVRRGEKTLRKTVRLSGKWRLNEDPSWRESTHVAGPGGGFWGRKLDTDEKKKQGLAPGDLGLLVTYIWGNHARRAGLKLDDVVISVDGLRRDMTIRQMHAHLHLQRNYGDTVPIAVRRKGQKVELSMKLPAEAPRLE